MSDKPNTDTGLTKPVTRVGAIGYVNNSGAMLALAIALAARQLPTILDMPVKEPVTKVGDVWVCNFSAMRLTVKSVDERGIIATQNVYYSHGNNDMTVDFDRLQSGYTKEVTNVG